MAFKVNILMGVCIALITTGCTNNLQVSKLGSDPSVEDRKGFPYSLQFTQYKTVLQRRVTKCAGAISIAVKADVSSELVDDGDHTYVIKSNSLISPMKVSQLNVEWTKGKLTSINGSAEDRTAQTILSTVQAFGKIATTLISPGGFVAADGAKEGCNELTKTHLRKLKSAKEEVAEFTTDITELTKEAVRLKAILLETSGDSAVKRQLRDILNKVDSKKLKLASVESQLSKAIKFLTHEVTIEWPTSSSQFASDMPFELPASALDKWYVFPRVPGEADKDYKPRKKKRYDTIREKVQVFFSIERVGTYGRNPLNGTATASDNGSASDGLRFRLPAKGKFVICQKEKCTSNDKAKVVTAHSSAVVQLGHIFYFPFSSPPFTNATFNMSFDENGVPTKAGIGRKAASAETAANLFKDLATEGASVFDSLNETDAERQARELAALEAQKKILDAQAVLDPTSMANILAALETEKKILDATKALVTSPTAELLQLTAIAQEQKNYQDALLALSADPNAPIIELKESFEADATLLQAKAAAIEANILLKDARARLDALED